MFLPSLNNWRKFLRMAGWLSASEVNFVRLQTATFLCGMRTHQ